MGYEQTSVADMIVEEARVSSYSDLRVYRLSFDLQQRIFKMTQSFPREEIYSLTDQIRRSSRSVGANLAEGWQKRSYPAHFIAKLTDADAELAETEHWLKTAFSCGYVSSADYEVLIESRRFIGRMLGGMKSKADSFCGK